MLWKIEIMWDESASSLPLELSLNDDKKGAGLDHGIFLKRRETAENGDFDFTHFSFMFLCLDSFVYFGVYSFVRRIHG